MNTCIALFRGINVGGHNKLPMKELKALLENLGYQNINTYIRTGNVVFQTEEKDKQDISKNISSGVEKKYGFKPDVLLLDLNELQDAIASNPFPEAESDPKSLHVGFLASVPPDPNLESLKNIKKETERFKLRDKVFYLHAPEGVGRSKLAGKAEKSLAVSMTSRNWRTVQKIMAMVKGYY